MRVKSKQPQEVEGRVKRGRKGKKGKKLEKQKIYEENDRNWRE